jgi:serine phosphatase RsbU (regulator of sigma subunit)
MNRMETKAVAVLLIDDDEEDYMITRDLLKDIQSRRFDIQWASTFENGLALMKRNVYDIFLVDYNLGQHNGLDLVREAISAGCAAPVIMLTGQDDEKTDLEAMEAGAVDYLIKGKIDTALLERSIRYSLERNRVEKELRQSHQMEREAREKLEEAMAAIDMELEMARKVQESMLPKDVGSIKGLTISAGYFPCGRVGGDLYDIIKINEHKTCFLMFDVVGHGVPAALISAMAKVSFSKNITLFQSPGEIMERVNMEIVNLFEEKRHITAFLGIYDAATKELSFVKAGHPSPLVVHANKNEIDHLTSSGLPLGMFPDIRYTAVTTGVCPGDTLVVYTDGLTECCNSDDKTFGRKGLEEVLRNLPKESAPDDYLGALIKAQLIFSRGAAKMDDITVLVIKIS